MQLSYQTANTAVNLSPACIRFFKYLGPLTRNEVGAAFARIDHYARKFQVTRRTIFLWLAALRDAGLIRTVRDGRRVLIFCLGPSPKPSRWISPIPASPSSKGLIREDSNTAPAPVPEAAAADVVVEEIEKAGVSRPVAVRFAREDPQECRRQLRNPWVRGKARDITAAFIAAVTGRYDYQPQKQAGGTSQGISVAKTTHPHSRVVSAAAAAAAFQREVEAKRAAGRG